LGYIEVSRYGLRRPASAYLRFVILRLWRSYSDNLKIVRIERLFSFTLFASSLSAGNAADFLVLVLVRVIVIVFDNKAFANL
jgi:hypothetical protein